MNPLLHDELVQILRDEVARPKTLGDVLADAYQLEAADRMVVEKFMRASRTHGLELSEDSLRKTDAQTLRLMWGLT